MPEPIKNAELLRMRLGAGNFIGGFFTRALETQLHVVESGFDQCREPCFIQGQAGGDEIDVQAGGARRADEIDDVGAGERFPSGEINLEDTGFGSVFEDPAPDFCGEFASARL